MKTRFVEAVGKSNISTELFFPASTFGYKAQGHHRKEWEKTKTRGGCKWDQMQGPKIPDTKYNIQIQGHNHKEWQRTKKEKKMEMRPNRRAKNITYILQITKYKIQKRLFWRVCIFHTFLIATHRNHLCLDTDKLSVISLECKLQPFVWEVAKIPPLASSQMQYRTELNATIWSSMQHAVQFKC